MVHSIKQTAEDKRWQIQQNTDTVRRYSALTKGDLKQVAVEAAKIHKMAGGGQVKTSSSKKK